MTDTLLAAIISVVGTLLLFALDRLFPKQEVKGKHQVARARLGLIWSPMILVLLGGLAYALLAGTGDKTIPIPFLGEDNALNPDLGWVAGSSAHSLYKVYSKDTLELIAGGTTWPLFPTLIYRYTIRGDFSVQLEIDFTSVEDALPYAAQMAGLIVRPMNDQLMAVDERFPDDWVVNRKSVADTGHGIGCRGSTTDYNEPIAYLRVDKTGEIWRCAYSKNGEDWIWSEPPVDDSLTHSAMVELVLFAYSSNEEAVTAEFRNWQIIERGSP